MPFDYKVGDFFGIANAGLIPAHLTVEKILDALFSNEAKAKFEQLYTTFEDALNKINKQPLLAIFNGTSDLRYRYSGNKFPNRIDWLHFLRAEKKGNIIQCQINGQYYCIEVFVMIMDNPQHGHLCMPGEVKPTLNQPCPSRFQ